MAIATGIAKHDDVEVLAAAEYPPLGVGPTAPVRLEGMAFDPVRAGELVDERRGREARQTADAHERFVAGVGPDASATWRPIVISSIAKPSSDTWR